MVYHVFHWNIFFPIFGRHCSANIFFLFKTQLLGFILCFGLNCAIEMAEANAKYSAIFVSTFNSVYSIQSKFILDEYKFLIIIWNFNYMPFQYVLFSLHNVSN